MEFRDLKIGQKFRFTNQFGLDKKTIRTKVSQRTFKNRGDKVSRTSRLGYDVTPLKESLLSFKQFLNEGFRKAWWYNSRTKKSVKVSIIHADVIEQTPEKLGLTDKDVFSVGGKKNDFPTRDFFSDKLSELLKRKGWAEVSLTTDMGSRGSDEANIRTESSREAKETLKWIIATFHPTLERVFITNQKAPKHINLQGGQIEVFVKTGRVQRTEIGSTMARFR